MTLTKIVAAIALHGPVAWCARWHNKVHGADLRELFFEEAMTLSAVLPWDVSSAKPQPLTLDVSHGLYPVAAASHPETTPSALATDSLATSSAKPLAQKGLST